MSFTVAASSLLQDPVILFACLLLLGLALLVLLGWREARSLRVTRFAVQSPHFPPALHGLRLLHLTDLHLPAYRALRRHVLETTEALHPDLICLTGDVVSHPRHIALARDFLEALGTVAPLFVVPGNGEYWRGIPQDQLAPLAEASGGAWLINQAAHHRARGASVAIVGVADPELEHADFSAAFADVPAADLALLLVHSPVAWREMAQRSTDFDLALTGHIHGGQWRIPRLPALLTHSQAPRYLASGLFRVTADGPPVQILGHWNLLAASGEPVPIPPDAHPLLYVSRGLGTAGIPLRLASPPEIVLFEFGSP